MPRPAARRCIAARRAPVLAQGCILALAGYIPLLNLLIPVIGTAAMVHVLDRRDAGRFGCGMRIGVDNRSPTRLFRRAAAC